jgi:hypothetical protein
MILSLINGLLETECTFCGIIKITDTTVIPTLKKLEEFNEYENINIPCDCGAVKVINMNIPVNDTDEDVNTGDLPVEEEVQRHYIRILQREKREDFLANKATSGNIEK